MNVSMFVCMKRVTPSYIAYFDILTFEILTRGMVFLEESEVVDGLLRYLKKLRTGSPLLSSGHFLLLARFFRSSALTTESLTQATVKLVLTIFS